MKKTTFVIYFILFSFLKCYSQGSKDSVKNSKCDGPLYVIDLQFNKENLDSIFIKGHESNLLLYKRKHNFDTYLKSNISGAELMFLNDSIKNFVYLKNNNLEFRLLNDRNGLVKFILYREKCIYYVYSFDDNGDLQYCFTCDYEKTNYCFMETYESKKLIQKAYYIPLIFIDEHMKVNLTTNDLGFNAYWLSSEYYDHDGKVYLNEKRNQ
jgi:hypothetical protein